MEIDCTGTIFAKYFGQVGCLDVFQVCDQVSFGCPLGRPKNPNRRLIKEYNRKPARYRRSLNDVVKDVKGRVSVSYSNLVRRSEQLPDPRFLAASDPPADEAAEDSEAELTPSKLESSALDKCKTALYYLGAGVGAVGLGTLAAVGLCAVGGVACSVFLVERLLCVDPEYQRELKALEVPNVYRPDLNNELYEYRSPYRY